MMLERLVLVLVMTVNLYAPGSLKAGNVIYYVRPTSPHKETSECPKGKLCQTWDQYASNVSKYFDGKDNVSMIFLTGTHDAARCLNITCPSIDHPCLNLTMSPAHESSDKVVIQLHCGIKLTYINILSMSGLTIRGMQKFGVELNYAPMQALTLNQVTLVGGAFWLNGDHSSVVKIIDSKFEASLLDMKFQFSDVVDIIIVRSNFMTSIKQKNVICISGIWGSTNIFLDGVHTTSYAKSDIVPDAPQPRHCFHTEGSPMATDVTILGDTGQVNSTILNSIFARGLGTALYFNLGQVQITHQINKMQTTNCVFKHHNERAFILKFAEVFSVNVTFDNCTFENNSYYGGSEVGSSGIQVIFPLQEIQDSIYESEVACFVNFQDCLFKHNKGQVVLVYKSRNTTFTNCTFAENAGTALVAFHVDHLVFSGEMKFLNNSAYRGGGLVLIESVLYVDSLASITFHGNRVSNKGGAILVEGSLATTEDDPHTTDHCFYQFWSKDTSQKIKFKDNYALHGGHNIYGAPLASHCLVYDQPDHKSRSIDELRYGGVFHFHPQTLSSVSSDPKRVCLCNSSGAPLCDDIDSIFVVGDAVHPGEAFALSLVVVGVEFGTVTGVIQANLTASDGIVTPGYSTVTEITKCTELTFSVHHFSPSNVQMYITIEDRYAPFYSKDVIAQAIQTFEKGNVVPTELLSTSLLVDIALLPCPPGFLLMGRPPICDCYPQIAGYVNCKIFNGTGLISRNDSVWIGIDEENNTIFSSSCPFEHCNFTMSWFALMDADSQCAFHHAGRLCGACDVNYSLAIGSTHCVHCQDNRFLSLILFFLAAGLALVLLIHLLNLTVTKGTIHGIILYANIVWTYQQVLFPQQSTVAYPLRVYLAWLNLDFGIESCFVKGLNAFWKTWLQFVFPLYVWIVAGIIIIACRYSVKLTNVFGEKAVHTLVTLFLMSYLKLLQTIVDVCVYTTLTVLPSQTTLTVWSLDGNLIYARYPHVLLLLVALAFVVFVYLLYTLAIFLIQWLRKMSHLKLFKWVMRLKPFFDAHLAPLKDRHHYWLGAVLILRVVLLLIFTLTGSEYPKISLFVLLIAATLFGLYMLFHQIFKSRTVLFLEGLCNRSGTVLIGVGQQEWDSTNRSGTVGVGQ